MLECNNKAQEWYTKTRQVSLDISSVLKIEDYVVQALEEVSPVKWHLAHTTWFFEEFVLKKFVAGYKTFESKYYLLFNSYYETIGYPFYSRSKRGTLSRPTVMEILEYREYVDEAVESCLDECLKNIDSKEVFLTGIHHEKQHQELMLMDIKCNFFSNPLFPVYNAGELPPSVVCPVVFYDLPSSLDAIFGINSTDEGFVYDNERPSHIRRIDSFQLASRPINNGEYLEFIQDGGYQDASLWLGDAWGWLQKCQRKWPMYWINNDEEWFEFTLHGLLPLDKNSYVRHVTFYEADAFSRWRSCRLPTEFEWEYACNFFSSKERHQQGDFYHKDLLEFVVSDVPNKNDAVVSMLGGVWEYTSSHYEPYPKSLPNAGTIGEYNHKFMNAQRVLRGGSVLTSLDHIRSSYRNFFQMDKFWCYGGIRLAKDE